MNISEFFQRTERKKGMSVKAEIAESNSTSPTKPTKPWYNETSTRKPSPNKNNMVDGEYVVKEPTTTKYVVKEPTTTKYVVKEPTTTKYVVKEPYRPPQARGPKITMVSESDRNRAKNRSADRKYGSDRNRYNRSRSNDRSTRSGSARKGKSARSGSSRSGRNDRTRTKPKDPSVWGSKQIDTTTEEGKIAANVRLAQGYLNKMTKLTFDRLSDKFLEVARKEEIPGLLKMLIDRVFEQALLQPSFCNIYAFLCQKIHHDIKSFRMVLLNKCQEEFERGSKAPPAELEGLEKTGFEYKAKKRMLGNIKFIGELYKNNVLVEPVMYECIVRLLDQDPEEPDEEQTEALCDLMINVGKLLDTKRNEKRMNGYFDQMKSIQNGNVQMRIRFMLEDLKDLRGKGW